MPLAGLSVMVGTQPVMLIAFAGEVAISPPVDKVKLVGPVGAAKGTVTFTEAEFGGVIVTRLTTADGSDAAVTPCTQLVPDPPTVSW